MTTSPGIDCITGRHIDFHIYDEHGTFVGSWCAWCGTAAYDGDRITDDNQAIGFVPQYRIQVADGFHRMLTA